MADEKPGTRGQGQGPDQAAPGPKARPTAPAGVLGTPAQVKSQEGAANKLPRSVFAQTIVGIRDDGDAAGAADAADRPSARPLPPPISVQAGLHTTTEAEPLRVPSERPVPAPFGAPQGRALGAAGLTKPMPSSTAPGNRSEERLIAVRPDALTNPEHQLERPVQAHKAPPQKPAEMTRPMPGGASPRPPAPTGHKPIITTVQPSDRAKAPADASKTASARPAPAPRTQAAASTPAPRVIPSDMRTPPAGKPPRKHNTSEPLSLALDASDDLEGASINAPARGRGPLIALIVTVLFVGAVLAWTQRPQDASTTAAPTAELPSRTTAEPAQVEPVQAEPAQAQPEATPKAAAQDIPAEVESEPKPEPKPKPKLEPKAEPARAVKAQKPRKPVVLLKDEQPVLRVQPKDEATSTDDLLERAARAAEAAEAEERGQDEGERYVPPPPSPD